MASTAATPDLIVAPGLSLRTPQRVQGWLPWAFWVVLYFFLTYFETQSVGGVKYAVLWRSAVFLPALFIIWTHPLPMGARALASLFWAYLFFCFGPIWGIALGIPDVAYSVNLSSNRMFVPIMLMALMALAATAVLASLWIIYTLVPPLVTELNQRLSGPLPRFWFAGILETLATIWESMSPTEKAALGLIGTAAVVLSGGTLGLGLSVGLGITTVLDAARPAATFMRDPQGTTNQYLATHNDLEIAADAGLAAMAVIPGGKALRGAGYAATTARAAKPVKRFAQAQARRGLNPRAGIHQPGLRTPRPGRSDGGVGTWGPGKNYGSPRSQAYEEQVTGVPIEHSYYVNGTEFDGYNGFALVDAKGEGYDPLIKGDWSNEPKSTPEKIDPVTGKVTPKKKGLIEIAEDQAGAVRATGTDTPIQWHIAEKYTFDTLREKQYWGEFPVEIELIHTPPN